MGYVADAHPLVLGWSARSSDEIECATCSHPWTTLLVFCQHLLQGGPTAPHVCVRKHGSSSLSKCALTLSGRAVSLTGGQADRGEPNQRTRRRTNLSGACSGTPDARPWVGSVRRSALLPRITLVPQVHEVPLVTHMHGDSMSRAPGGGAFVHAMICTAQRVEISKKSNYPASTASREYHLIVFLQT